MLPGWPVSCWIRGAIQNATPTSAATIEGLACRGPELAEAGALVDEQQHDRRARQPEHDGRVAHLGLHDVRADAHRPRQAPEVTVGHRPGEQHEREQRDERHPRVPGIDEERRADRPDEHEADQQRDAGEERAATAARHDHGADECGEVGQAHGHERAGDPHRPLERRHEPVLRGPRVVPAVVARHHAEQGGVAAEDVAGAHHHDRVVGRRAPAPARHDRDDDERRDGDQERLAEPQPAVVAGAVGRADRLGRRTGEVGGGALVDGALTG